MIENKYRDRNMLKRDTQTWQVEKECSYFTVKTGMPHCKKLRCMCCHPRYQHQCEQFKKVLNPN